MATVATLLTLVALVSMWAYGKTSLALRTADAERQRAETALGQVEAEKSRAQTALVQVEAERNRAEAEKARAEAERRRSDEQKQVAQAAEKNALEAKRHAEESEKNALEAQRRIELSMYQANIQLARRDWLAAMVDEADRRLDACPVESRKWEWNYLKRLCHLRGAVVVKRPISERIWDPRASLRLSPDWQCFATIGPGPRSGADRVVKICDASGGRLLTTLQGQEYLERIGFSPDGGKIAGLSRSDLTVWNPRTGEKIVSVPAKGVQTRWAFRPDGRQIATTEPGPLPRESTVRIHDATSGKELRALKIKIKGGPRENQVRTFIAYSPDGKLIATGGQDVINIWNATSGDEIRQMTGHQSDIWDLSFSPDGTRIASASMDRSARVWDVTTGQQLLTLRGHNDIVTGVRFSPSGKEIATASVDGTLRTWDAATGSERLTFRGHAQPIYSVDFDPKGEHIATTSDDGTIRIWNSAEEQQYRTSPGFGEPLVNHHVPFGIDWKRVRNGPDALDSCLAPHVAQNGTYVLFASPDTKRAVGLTADRTGIALWDTENGQELLVLKKGWQLQRGVLRPLGCFSPDGRKIALQPPTRGWEERCDLEILDAATGALVCTLPNPGATSSLAFSPDGKRVAGDASQQLRIWTVEHGRLDAEIEFKREPSEEPLAGTLGFSPNGRWIAWRGMGGTDRAVRTLDLERGNKITELHGHRYGASCLTFSPD
ncbi:MAG TPA: hypothetical protein VMF30_07765, partial [Pirellulales bacterium]|nr:hypothetical protein [Pirellulales bacterium]